MPPAPLPPDETARLFALTACDVLDTEAEELFDDLTRLAARLGEVPIALVSLVDKKRQWFKSAVGLGDVTETPRDWAFCAHAILQQETLVIEDASRDPRTLDNPLVTGDPRIRFYAGAPLRTEEGHALGTLCLIDVVPRALTAGQQADLEALARQVSALLELRKNSQELEQLGSALAVRNAALEEMARKAELAATAKSEFLANMSHEIRTPMNAVIGLTERLLESQLDDLQRDYLRTVLDSADSLLEIIDDVLDFSKLEAGKLQLEAAAFCLDDVVGDALRALSPKAHERGLELAYRLAPEVPHSVIGDRGRLRQILINLVGNAIKFTDRGHCLVEVDRVASEHHPYNRARLEFVVRDTGVGISAEKLEVIFGVFEQADASTTRRYGGTGLGLAITKRLVEQMDGQIEVASQVGCGSTFTFTASFQDLPQQPTPESWMGGLKPTDVLVAAKHPVTRAIVSEMLSARQMQPIVVASQHEALQAAVAAHRRETPLALLIIEIGLAGGDGSDLVRQIRTELSAAATPVILLSSLDDLGQIQAIQQLDRCQTLMMPVKQGELLAAIRHALGHGGPEADAMPAVGQEGGDRGGNDTLPPLKILLAEDSVANQKLALAILEKQGHQATVADNGREALAVLAAGSFDLVLMDIQMPELDGYAATAAIRAAELLTGGHLPIVAMTAHALQGDRERCLEAGMDGYVSKPVRPDLLHEALVTAWSRRAQPCATV